MQPCRLYIHLAAVTQRWSGCSHAQFISRAERFLMGVDETGSESTTPHSDGETVVHVDFKAERNPSKRRLRRRLFSRRVNRAMAGVASSDPRTGSAEWL